MNSKQLLVSAIVTISLFSTAIPVFAVGSVKENLQEARQELASCANISGRIDIKLGIYKTLRENHLNRFNNTRDRIKKLIERLDAKGMDTTKVKADLQTLGTKIDKLATDTNNFITKLESTKEFDCADSKGKFKETVDAARTLRATIKADVTDIKNFLQTILRVDVKALRAAPSA